MGAGLRKPGLCYFLPHPQALLGNSGTWKMNVGGGSPRCGRRGSVSQAGGILRVKRAKIRHQKPDSQPCGRNPEKTGRSPAGEESTWRLLPILLGCC